MRQSFEGDRPRIGDSTRTEADEWRRVALDHWRHYRDNVWEKGAPTSVHYWSHHLAKMIPYLLGMPEEAWLPEDGRRSVSFSIEAGGISPEAFQIITGLSVEEAKAMQERASEEAFEKAYSPPDTELPGMWEAADFTGGQDEVRPRMALEHVADGHVPGD